MKNLAKFFVAVAALFVGVSCTTDTTEDLGQQIVGKGQTVLTVSTGESVLDTKTSLGGKVDGTYPIYWSNGDQLSLNGVASAPLANVEENATSATFTWEGTFDAPFCVAYPASDEGTVTFAAEQEYVEGTFSQNAVPMIGYADEAGVSGVQLEYLAGVLQFNVSGAATLASMIIETVDGTPIAGVFDCDFATGTVKPQAGSRSSIEYSFGEGLDISGGKSFHVAVPAGQYDAVKVIMLNAEGGAFEGTVKADGTEKPELAAGHVREFTISNWSANKTYKVIKDAQTLEQFATAVEDTPALEAVVLKDVDASSLTDWAPIEGFTGLLRGNGKTISGLTQALFGTLSGTVTNLTLESTIAIGNAASATDTTNNYYGVFAKEANGASLISCTAKGAGSTPTFTVANAVYKNLYATATELCYGGLVGYAENTVFKGCTNSVLIQVTRPCVDDHSNNGKKYPAPSFGGIVGYALGCTIDGCANNAEQFDWNLSASKSHTYSIQYGGIVGYAAAGADAANPGSISNCTNSSYMRFRSGTRISSVGGIVGHTQVNVSHCENTADLTLGTESHRYGNGYGGVVGYVSGGAELMYLVNRGAITLGDKAKYTKMVIGGIVGLGVNTSKVAACENYGPINISGTREAVSSTYSAFRVGGIAGQFDGTVTANINHESAAISVTSKGVLGKAAGGYTNSVPNNCIGGIAGVKSDSGFTNNTNNAPITFSPSQALVANSENVDSDLGDASPFIGGIGGFCSSIPSGCDNTGDITVEGTFDFAGLHVGGIMARCVSASEFSNAKNSGNINVSAVTGGDVYIGGVSAWANLRADEYINNDNEGNITFSGTARLAHIGGVVGLKDHHSTGITAADGVETYAVDQWVASTFTNCDNSGDITIEATAQLYGYTVGGVGGTLCVTAENCTNSGAIKVLADQQQPTYTEDFYYIPVKVGGIAGAGQGSFTTCKNLEDGDITVSGDAYPMVHFGLKTSYASADATVAKGTLIFPDVPEVIRTNITGWPKSYVRDVRSSSDANGVYYNNGNGIGGVIGVLSSGSIPGCENHGDIIVSSDAKTNEAYHYTNYNKSGEAVTANAETYTWFTAGLIGYTGNNQTGAAKTNYGNITVSGDYTAPGYATHIAGCVGRPGSGSNSAVHNRGDITVTGKFGASLHVAGIVSQTPAGTWSNCSNKENTITISSTAVVGGTLYVGGIANATGAATTFSSCQNEGHINVGVNGVPGNLVAGGIVGYFEKATADKEQVKNCSNSGNISVTGTNLTGGVFVGGLTGSQGTAVMKVTTFTNSGTISFSGSASKAYIGGIVGSGSRDVTGYTGLKNTGTITATGTSSGDYTVGGLFGRAKGTVTGIVKATVKAPAVKACGIAVGAPYDTTATTASGCQVAGKITRNGAAEVTLTADNFADYIIGVGQDANLTHTGCTFYTE